MKKYKTTLFSYILFIKKIILKREYNTHRNYTLNLMKILLFSSKTMQKNEIANYIQMQHAIFFSKFKQTIWRASISRSDLYIVKLIQK